MSIGIKLLEVESKSLSQHISGVSTISFYQGDVNKAAQALRTRFSLILKLNPWLAGKLVRTKENKYLELVYPELSNLNINELFTLSPKNIEIHSNMSYSDLGKTCIPLIVQKPIRIINTDSLVTKLSLVADSEDNSNKFSIIFSLSHSVADGHTYYTILNMLSQDVPIYALNISRKENELSNAIQSLGEQRYKYLTKLPHIFNVFSGLFFRKNARAYAFYIDNEKISQVKSKAKTKSSFVSTNDIVTSSFFSFIGARLGAMAINFRSKTQGLDEIDAGNYEGAILYDEKNYKEAEGIRKSLLDPLDYIGLSKPLPNILEGMFCKMGLITNWASFAKDLNIPHCQQILHLPLTNTAGPMPYEMCVVFRAKEDKTGIIYFTQRFKKEDFNPQNLPISNLISEKIFN